MKIKQFTLLWISAFFVLTGCYEKGNVIPPSPKQKKKKEKRVYDFPVLKLSATSQQNKTKQNLNKNITLTKKKITKKKILKKIRPKRKRKSSGHIPIIGSFTSMISNISLQEVPILNQIIPKPSETSKARIRKTQAKPYKHPQKKRSASIPVLDNSTASTPLSFSGGTSVSGLDMAKIRIETDNYQTNIVLDSYLWIKHNNLPTEASSVSGTYFLRYEPSNNRIVGHIKGYKTFSALLTKQDEMIKNNPMIKDIYIDRYVGDDGIKFIIELKKRVKVNIIDVEDPGSIIVELYPLEASP